MRVPLSWLAEHVDLPAGSSARAVADALVRVGLEVERVDEVASGLEGPLVVGRVVAHADEPQTMPRGPSSPTATSSSSHCRVRSCRVASRSRRAVRTATSPTG